MESAFRTVWLSDVHLGSRACRVGLLLDFLRRTRCETLYLVGDIFDLQSLRRSFFWPTSHTEVLRELLKKSGTRIVYVPGNHDDDMRALIGLRFDNIEVVGRCVHTTRAGRRLLVLHGDEFDGVIKHNLLAAFVGARLCKRPQRRASMASSAGTFTRRISSSATGSLTVTTAIGSRAAPRSSSMRAASSRSSPGGRTRPLSAWRRRFATPRECED